jgi:hypothetical protein
MTGARGRAAGFAAKDAEHGHLFTSYVNNIF